jgi:hypothetical protein
MVETCGVGKQRTRREQNAFAQSGIEQGV